MAKTFGIHDNTRESKKSTTHLAFSSYQTMVLLPLCSKNRRVATKSELERPPVSLFALEAFSSPPSSFVLGLFLSPRSWESLSMVITASALSTAASMLLLLQRKKYYNCLFSVCDVTSVFWITLPNTCFSCGHQILLLVVFTCSSIATGPLVQPAYPCAVRHLIYTVYSMESRGFFMCICTVS